MDVIRISAEHLFNNVNCPGWIKLLKLPPRTGMFGLPGGLTTDAC